MQSAIAQALHLPKHQRIHLRVSLHPAGLQPVYSALTTFSRLPLPFHMYNLGTQPT